MMRAPMVLMIGFATAAVLAAQPHIVFVTGDHEYGGEETMPLLAQALQQRYGFKTTVLYAARPDGTRDHNYEENIPGLEKLRDADAALFFLRWRKLPASQVTEIDRYLKTGRPLLGLRTTSHAFNYPKGHELERWNAFGQFAFVTPPGWGAASSSSTRIRRPWSWHGAGSARFRWPRRPGKQSSDASSARSRRFE